jgi:mono/diheme cytochrome c family protein
MNYRRSIVGVLLTLLIGAILHQDSRAQSKPISPPRQNLTKQQLRGRALIMQNCSVCHLPQVPRPRRSYGPSLSGLLNQPNGANEKQVREAILQGSPKMPAYKYALSAAEVDDIISFLKVF